jgi:hypothetical protein
VVRDYGGDGKVFRRDFENGIVVCNPSERDTALHLHGSYRLIQGKQQPKINTGKLLTSLIIESKDGRILLNGDLVAYNDVK